MANSCGGSASVGANWLCQIVRGSPSIANRANRRLPLFSLLKLVNAQDLFGMESFFGRELTLPLGAFAPRESPHFAQRPLSWAVRSAKVPGRTGSHSTSTTTWQVRLQLHEKPEFVKKFVSEQWLLSCLSLAIHLSTTCKSQYWPRISM